MAVHLNPVTNWACKHCNTQAVTRKGEANRFHQCPGLKWVYAPLIPEGTRCEVRVHVREDYVGREMVTRDEEGRPVMAVETVRDDGNDVVVFAPCATTNAEARI